MDCVVFQVGQIVEFLEGPFKGEEAVVWEIGDEYLGLIRHEDEYKSVVTPYYVSHGDAASQICPLRPKQEPDHPRHRDWIPAQASLAYGTTNHHCQGRFDSEMIVVSLGAVGPVLDVHCSRYTAIFPGVGVKTEPEDGWDGDWPYFRLLSPSEWESVQEAFRRFDFWSLPYDDAVRTDDFEECWQLFAFQDGKQHEVRRLHVPNEIEEFCRLLFSVAEQPGLVRGSSAVPR